MAEFNRIVRLLRQEMSEFLSGSGVYANLEPTSDASGRAKIKAFDDRVHHYLLALLFALSHHTKEEGERKCEDMETQAEVEDKGVVELEKKGQVIDEDHEEHSKQLSLEATKRGTKRAATAKTSTVRKKTLCTSKQVDDIEAEDLGNGSFTTSEETRGNNQGDDEGARGEAAVEQERFRNRAENWTDKETDTLLAEFLKRKKHVGRFDREPLWESVSRELQRQNYGRTGDQCRERMETLKKSFTTISKYCNEHKKEFGQLQEEDYQNMKPRKPATRLLEGWYNCIAHECPPKSRTMKSMARQDKDVASGGSSAGMTGATTPFTSKSCEGQATLGTGVDMMCSKSISCHSPQQFLTSEKTTSDGGRLRYINSGMTPPPDPVLLEDMGSPTGELEDLKDWDESAQIEFRDFLNCLLNDPEQRLQSQE